MKVLSEITIKKLYQLIGTNYFTVMIITKRKAEHHLTIRFILNLQKRRNDCAIKFQMLACLKIYQEFQVSF
ncbi:hypothetical protein BpHYR1_012635 [Brachionus plicatilis]|uniref:Uncharacterized protein n=1 Tax=Brachionus plicatilis TaxID=10195 RepID=A0A3M7SVE4_BRAPC|nr:hypothetical protein BpHYR1_012635 [Brachionus plicatilis]